VIRRLRRRHRATWLALAIVLPVLYVIALVARQPAPVVDSLPAPLRADASAEPAP
jgi:uncharacterized membrane protein YhaH (DUF805 family)